MLFKKQSEELKSQKSGRSHLQVAVKTKVFDRSKLATAGQQV